MSTNTVDSEQNSPWRFLKPLDGNESDDRALVALTRADELRIVSDMISASRVSLLYAPSGNGKSSLLNAGVIPTFKEKGYCVFRTRPRPPHSPLDPLLAFKESILAEPPSLFSLHDVLRFRQIRKQLTQRPEGLEREAEDVLRQVEYKILQLQQVPAPSTSEFVTLLRNQIRAPLVEFVGRIAELIGDETKILLICDQFEELFVHYNNTPQLEEFVRQLGELWSETALRVGLLFSMREDWVGSMIAFRKAVPDIFANYYKLYPLASSCAEKVLKEPLEQRGIKWGSGVAERVISDLAGSYQLNQADRFNGIDLLPSPKNDPYVELPALQVVAEKLWQTRSGQHEPFSMAHYNSLGPEPRALPLSQEGEASTPAQPPAVSSPANWCLDHYLPDQLSKLEEGDELKDLRLDCLYLLTDRIRHRRALPRQLLLEELNQLRRGGLGLAHVDGVLFERAIGPLIACRLVSKTEIGGRGTQFELAHDFAVRSVVREWRRLNQERAIEEALRLRQREEAELRTAELARRERRALKFLQVGPGASLLLLAGFIVYFVPSYSFEKFVGVGALAGLLGALFAGTLFVGWTTQEILSCAVGALGLVTAVILTNASQPSQRVKFGLIVGLVSLIAVYVRSIVSLSTRLGSSSRIRRYWRVMACELVDILFGVGPLILIPFCSSLLFDYKRDPILWWGLVVACSCTMLNAILAVRLGTTLGLRSVGLLLRNRDGSKAHPTRVLLRQFLFLCWSLLNFFFLLPWFFGTSLIVWFTTRNQNFYDSWAGTALADAGELKTDSGSEVARVPEATAPSSPIAP